MTEKSGEDKANRALNFLVGQVLKSEPRANPAIVRDLIIKKLCEST